MQQTPAESRRTKKKKKDGENERGMDDFSGGFDCKCVCVAEMSDFSE